LDFVSPIEFEKADALISVSAKSGEFQLVMPGDKFSVLIGDISLIGCINASGLALSQPIYMMNYRSEPLSDFCKDSEYTRCWIMVMNHL
jgi:hypothetical protein